jgi:ethanolamine utilization protein EutN
MLICKVKGKLVSTIKNKNLDGFSFVILQTLHQDRPDKKAQDDIMVAVDGIGCGIDNVVLVATGSSARYALKDKDVPVDAVVVGIIDTYNIEK